MSRSPIPLFYRVATLLRLARCRIVQELETNSTLVVEYFSPACPKLLACYVCCELDETKCVEGAAKAREAVSGIGYNNLELVVYVENESGAKLLDSVLFPVVAANTLADAVLSSTGYQDRLEHLLADYLPATEILARPCWEFLNPGGQRRESLDALLALTGFLSNSSNCLAAVMGSFGTGKTVLLYSLAVALKSEKYQCFPMLIQLSGVGSNGVSTAVEQALSDIFYAAAGVEIDELAEVLGPLRRPVLIFDSVDEQTEINSNEIGRLLDGIMQYVRKGFRVVLAFRPEILRGSSDASKIIGLYLNQTGLPYLEVLLRNFPDAVIERRLGSSFDASVTPELQATVYRLAKRPLWLGIITQLMSERGSLQGVDLLCLVEELISRWAIREQKTHRPLMSPEERALLSITLAFCVHGGYGIRITSERRVQRDDLVAFLRAILPDIQRTTPDRQDTERWLRLPPDLAAESLAVSNLMDVHEDGTLAFSDSVFLDYYLTLGLFYGLQNRLSELPSETILMEVLGIQSSHHLVGIAPLKAQSLVPELLREMFGRNSITPQSVTVTLARYLTGLRPQQNADIKSLKLSELVPDYRDDESAFTPDYSKAYHILPRDSWPQFATYRSALNAILLQQNSDGVVQNLDCSFLDLSCVHLRDIHFISCNFLGANWSYCDLHNLSFLDCDLRLGLFENVQADNIVIERCQTQLAFVISSPGLEELCHDAKPTLLNEMLQPDEVWVSPIKTRLMENEEVVVSVSRFAADKNPVSNRDFVSFTTACKDFRKKNHSQAIENPYYLSLLKKDPEDLDRPVVYISLIAATAYAGWKGKRLPSVAEYREYSKLGRRLPPRQKHDSYSDLPSISRDGFYPKDLLTEWTFQVDDRDYWRYIEAMYSLFRSDRICQFPPYRVRTKKRCEYFIEGDSYHRKSIEGQALSKQATWVNPDQSFRCVIDFQTVVYRWLQKHHLELASISKPTTSGADNVGLKGFGEVASFLP